MFFQFSLEAALLPLSRGSELANLLELIDKFEIAESDIAAARGSIEAWVEHLFDDRYRSI